MQHHKISSFDYKMFFFKAGIWIVFLGWLNFLLALSGFFYKPLIAGFFLLGAAYFFKRFWHKDMLQEISREMWLVSLGLLLATVLFSLHTTPTIFSGRDQGTISEAAIRLAQNHSLSFRTPATDVFFQIYGPGKALNFPGFYYKSDGSLTTQFPLVYIAWLAAFYAFFGLTGLLVANGVLFFFFLLSFYLLARHFFSARYGLLLLFFTLSSFSFMWFVKFTLTENMALTLVWFSLLALLVFLEERNFFNYYLFLATAALLVFTRIEGLALLPAGLLALLCSAPTRNWLFFHKKRALYFPLLLFAAVFLFNSIKDIYFYKEIARAIFTPLLKVPSGTMEEAITTPAKEFYTARLFALFGYIGFLAAGSIAIATLFVQKKFKLLVPFFVVLPTLTYLVDSYISSDYPWMLRRYAFTIVPVFIFYSMVLVDIILAKKWPAKIRQGLAFLLILFLLGFSLPAFAKYFTYSENRGLLPQIQALSNKFSAQDLVLVDKDATGSGWAMLTGPASFLFGKNTVYFFNPQDLAKLDRRKFANVYLIVSSERRNFYVPILSQFLPQENYFLQTDRLELMRGKLENPRLPQKQQAFMSGTIYKLTP